MLSVVTSKLSSWWILVVVFLWKKSLAIRFLTKYKIPFWIRATHANKVRIYTNSTIQLADKKFWFVFVDNVVVKDGHKPQLGRGVFETLQVTIQQPTIKSFCADSSRCPLKIQLHNYFPEWVSCIGKKKINTPKFELHKQCTPKHQNVRLVLY